MVGAARQQRAIDERFEPGQDRPKKLAHEALNQRRNVGQIAGAGP
jgi:hypothetical protein